MELRKLSKEILYTIHTKQLSCATCCLIPRQNARIQKCFNRDRDPMCGHKCAHAHVRACVGARASGHVCTRGHVKRMRACTYVRVRVYAPCANVCARVRVHARACGARARVSVRVCARMCAHTGACTTRVHACVCTCTCACGARVCECANVSCTHVWLIVLNTNQTNNAHQIANSTRSKCDEQVLALQHKIQQTSTSLRRLCVLSQCHSFALN